MHGTEILGYAQAVGQSQLTLQRHGARLRAGGAAPRWVRVRTVSPTELRVYVKLESFQTPPPLQICPENLMLPITLISVLILNSTMVYQLLLPSPPSTALKQ